MTPFDGKIIYGALNSILVCGVELEDDVVGVGISRNKMFILFIISTYYSKYK